MITAQKPWHSKHNADGSVEIFDGNCHRVALFADHRDADHVVELVNGRVDIDGLIDKALDHLDKFDVSQARHALRSIIL